MEKTKIIMDVDTGIDDAIAICLALGSDAFDVLGITTTFGNRKVDVTTKNTLKILELIGKTNIPVSKGAAKPIVKEYFSPEKSIVHGADGLGDMENPLPEPKIKETGMSAVEFMAKTLAESDEPVTIVPVGPMTNVATLLMTSPELKPKIKEIVVMGGSMLKGNASPVAEANIKQDPEAAYILLHSGVKIRMACLDATWNGYVSFDELEDWKTDNKLSRIFYQMCGIYSEHYKLRMKNPGLAMHDSMTLAWIARPELVKSEDYYVTVDIDGRYTYGMTVTDVNRVTGEKPNVTMSTDVDRVPFINMIKEAIARLSSEMK